MLEVVACFVEDSAICWALTGLDCVERVHPLTNSTTQDHVNILPSRDQCEILADQILALDEKSAVRAGIGGRSQQAVRSLMQTPSSPLEDRQ